MEGHKDDNDVDLSNDEELPPGPPTKEPKTSFTTAQVEELAQALGISQFHRSLQKISTSLEKKFTEDSDDLEQSSDKEKTSHSKRTASDSTSKRPSKRRKSQQCNSATQKSEQCSSAKKKRRVACLLTPLSTIFWNPPKMKSKRTSQQRIWIFQHHYQWWWMSWP